MKKGERTRRNIIEKSATIFNQKGYMTTSMTDIIQETKIQKGGIYRHFKDKEQLMIESFHYSVERMKQHFLTTVLNYDHAEDRLLTFAEEFLRLSEGKPIVGGCPIYNAAIEMDDLDGNALLPYIHEAIDGLIKWVASLIDEGITKRELKQSVQPYETAVFIISTLEGGVVLNRLKEGKLMNSILSHISNYISMIVNERP